MTTHPGTEPATEIAVRRSVDVPLGPPEAFALFTSRMTEFWPAANTINTSPIDQVVVEPRDGGRWYERGIDGSECAWGRVLAWEPPGRLVLAWQITGDWRMDPDFVTEVEVAFLEQPGNRTRVELTHRHLERYGEQAEQMRGTFESPGGGWAGILDAFAELAS